MKDIETGKEHLATRDHLLIDKVEVEESIQGKKRKQSFD
jgi:hypothetical protein